MIHAITEEQRERLKGKRVVASISGGKDSAALSLWLHENGIEHDRVFADTGWEAAVTYAYVFGELQRVIGKIAKVRADKQMIDLIRHKRTFPSKKKKWCTEELKLKPIKAHLDVLVAQGHDVVNAVGIRRMEGEERSEALEWEHADFYDCDVWRPLVEWTVEDVIAIHERHGLRPNPLYLMGANRVGCWPCIRSVKEEIRLIAEIDPERARLLGDLENEITEARGKPRSWFLSQMKNPETGKYYPLPFDEVVEWSRTSHGGKQFTAFGAAETGDGSCMKWGLCESPRPMTTLVNEESEDE